MEGKILAPPRGAENGVISGDDGNRYEFDLAQWKADGPPNAGIKVDFKVEGEAAVEVYALNATSSSAAGSKKVAAALFAFFLGAFGAHKFYLGYTKQGIIMLVVTLLGSLLVIPPIVIGVIAFVEFIIYLTKSDEEFEQTYVIGSKPWF